MPTVEIVLKGTGHYDGPRAAKSGALGAGVPVELVPEFDNPHDPNAVVVRLKVDGSKLGYIGRNLAPRYRRIVLAGLLDRAALKDAAQIKWADDSQRLRIAITVSYRKEDIARTARRKTAISPDGSDLPAGPGVYAIVNDEAGRTYIGSSVNVRTRIRNHFGALEDGLHANPLLQRDYDTSPEKRFRAVTLLRLQSTTQLESAEARAIQAALKSGQLLYNMTEDGRGNFAARYRHDYEIPEPQAISDRDRGKCTGGQKPGRVAAGASSQIPPMNETVSAALSAEVLPSSTQSSTRWIWFACISIIVVWLIG